MFRNLFWFMITLCPAWACTTFDSVQFQSKDQIETECFAVKDNALQNVMAIKCTFTNLKNSAQELKIEAISFPKFSENISIYTPDEFKKNQSGSQSTLPAPEAQMIRFVSLSSLMKSPRSPESGLLILLLSSATMAGTIRNIRPENQPNLLSDYHKKWLLKDRTKLDPLETKSLLLLTNRGSGDDIPEKISLSLSKPAEAIKIVPLKIDLKLIRARPVLP